MNTYGMGARVAAKSLASSLDDPAAYCGSLNHSQTAPVPEKQPEIPRQLERLDMEVDALQERMNIHIHRLSFVLDLSPRGESAECDQKGRMVASELGQRLQCLAERLRLIREMLAAADSALEI